MFKLTIELNTQSIIEREKIVKNAVKRCSFDRFEKFNLFDSSGKEVGFIKSQSSSK